MSPHRAEREISGWGYQFGCRSHRSSWYVPRWFMRPMPSTDMGTLATRTTPRATIEAMDTEAISTGTGSTGTGDTTAARTGHRRGPAHMVGVGSMAGGMTNHRLTTRGGPGLVAGLLLSVVVLTGCAVVVADEPGRAPGPPPYPAAGAPRIPRGHYPPPGECRVWFPDRPPGHQPPPGPCEELQYRVPPGAYLIRG